MALSQLLAKSLVPSRALCRSLSTDKASDPIQKLFVDKIREFKSTNKGLDAAHEKAMGEEMLRLKRVYRVEDENKLAQLDYKFSNEHHVSLHDIDESKELRSQIHSGAYQKQLKAKPEPPSALLASIPEQITQDLQLPPLNKPDPHLTLGTEILPPVKIGEIRPDYEYVGGKMTVDKLERQMRVKFGDNMPTIHDDKSPQRDLANFPTMPIPLNHSPTRHHIIPECWFQFFYPKTGVTGPYAFAFGFGSLLMSKEWLVMEHELLTAFSSTIIITYGVLKYGPQLTKFFRGLLDKEIDGWDNWQNGNIQFLKDIKQHYQGELEKKDILTELYDVRRQDVEVQLEHEYRNRLKTVYEDTKRRLNYLVAVADSQRQIHHKNMTNWVISNVLSSIGQKQENEILDSCVLNLKQLASKNANAI